jgi:endonuclease III
VQSEYVQISEKLLQLEARREQVAKEYEVKLELATSEFLKREAEQVEKHCRIVEDQYKGQLQESSKLYSDIDGVR